MTNKIYIAPETVIEWKDTGANKIMDLGSLAAGGVVMGAFNDRGAGARAHIWGFEFLIGGFSTAPVGTETVLLYLSQSIATTNFDGNPSTDPQAAAAGVMTTGQLRNLGIPFGFANQVSTTAGDKLKITGEVLITSRYFSPVVHNNAVDALHGTSSLHSLKMWPLPDEIQ